MNSGVACFGSPIDRLIGVSAGRAPRRRRAAAASRTGRAGAWRGRGSSGAGRRENCAGHDERQSWYYTGRYFTVSKPSPSAVFRTASHRRVSLRLTHLKLAGFKSFVDPTTIDVPSQLVGVVGPNGCGKSNIIDAVRWVLGETRASALRGESMQDVIFNGSALRSPVGAGERRAGVRQRAREGRGAVVAVRRDLG